MLSGACRGGRSHSRCNTPWLVGGLAAGGAHSSGQTATDKQHMALGAMAQVLLQPLMQLSLEAHPLPGQLSYPINSYF